MMKKTGQRRNKRSLAERVSLRFRREWDYNKFSDGKSIEIWIRQTISIKMWNMRKDDKVLSKDDFDNFFDPK